MFLFIHSVQAESYCLRENGHKCADVYQNLQVTDIKDGQLFDANVGVSGQVELPYSAVLNTNTFISFGNWFFYPNSLLFINCGGIGDGTFGGLQTFPPQVRFTATAQTTIDFMHISISPVTLAQLNLITIKSEQYDFNVDPNEKASVVVDDDSMDSVTFNVMSQKEFIVTFSQVDGTNYGVQIGETKITLPSLTKGYSFSVSAPIIKLMMAQAPTSAFNLKLDFTGKLDLIYDSSFDIMTSNKITVTLTGKNLEAIYTPNGDKPETLTATSIPLFRIPNCYCIYEKSQDVCINPDPLFEMKNYQSGTTEVQTFVGDRIYTFGHVKLPFDTFVSMDNTKSGFSLPGTLKIDGYLTLEVSKIYENPFLSIDLPPHVGLYGIKEAKLSTQTLGLKTDSQIYNVDITVTDQLRVELDSSFIGTIRPLSSFQKDIMDKTTIIIQNFQSLSQEITINAVENKIISKELVCEVPDAKSLKLNPSSAHVILSQNGLTSLTIHVPAQEMIFTKSFDSMAANSVKVETGTCTVLTQDGTKPSFISGESVGITYKAQAPILCIYENIKYCDSISEFPVTKIASSNVGSLTEVQLFGAPEIHFNGKIQMGIEKFKKENTIELAPTTFNQKYIFDTNSELTLSLTQNLVVDTLIITLGQIKINFDSYSIKSTYSTFSVTFLKNNVNLPLNTQNIAIDINSISETTSITCSAFTITGKYTFSHHNIQYQKINVNIDFPKKDSTDNLKVTSGTTVISLPVSAFNPTGKLLATSKLECAFTTETSPLIFSQKNFNPETQILRVESDVKAGYVYFKNSFDNVLPKSVEVEVNRRQSDLHEFTVMSEGHQDFLSLPSSMNNVISFQSQVNIPSQNPSPPPPPEAPPSYSIDANPITPKSESKKFPTWGIVIIVIGSVVVVAVVAIVVLNKLHIIHLWGNGDLSIEDKQSV